MASLKFTLSLLLFPLLLTLAHATNFNIVNRCSYTVWAAASPGGGRQLNSGQSWSLDIAGGTTGGRIWGRTGCSFNGNGQGHCTTGDCGGALSCNGYGTPPATLCEYSITDNCYYDMSLIEGFNIPMDIRPTNGNCKDVRCAADLTASCPSGQRVSGGCTNPCTTSNNCNPSAGSNFFKNNCPDAYALPNDPATNGCPLGTNFVVTFCP